MVENQKKIIPDSYQYLLEKFEKGRIESRYNFLAAALVYVEQAADFRREKAAAFSVYGNTNIHVLSKVKDLLRISML